MALRGAFILILLLAAVVRLSHLRTLPPFIDEGGHLQQALDYASWPLLDRVRHGKVFGFVAFYPTARFATDPLLATRMVVAFAGVLTTLGVIVLARRLANNTAALMAGLLWATMPYVVFHDRMALHDPLISLLVVWSTIGLAIGLDRNSKPVCIGAGLLLGLAILTKITAVVSGAVPLLVVVAPRGWQDARQHTWAILGFAAIPTGVAAVIATGAWLGVHFGDQFLRGGGSMTWQSVRDGVMAAPTWISDFNSVLFTTLAGVAMLGAVVRPSWVTTGLALSFVLGVLGHAIVLKLWFSRYLLPSLVPLVVLIGIVVARWMDRAGAAISRRLRRPGDWAAVGATFAAAVLMAGFTPRWLHSDLAFARDPRAAAMPPSDRHQYLDGWPSGYGLPEVVSFLNQQGQKSGKVLVLVGGNGRPGSWMLPLAAKVDPSVTVRPDHIFGREQLVKAAEEARRQVTFLVLEPPEYDLPESLLALVTPRPRLVFQYTRKDQGRWEVYAIDPSTHVAVSQ